MVINLESMKGSLNSQGDKTRIHQRKKLTKCLYFINNLFALEATKYINTKKVKLQDDQETFETLIIMRLGGKIPNFTKNGKIELNTKLYTIDLQSRSKTSRTLF